MAISMLRLCRTNSSLLHGLLKKLPSHFSPQMRLFFLLSFSAADGSHTVIPGNFLSSFTISGEAAAPSTKMKKNCGEKTMTAFQINVYVYSPEKTKYDDERWTEGM